VGEGSPEKNVKVSFPKKNGKGTIVSYPIRVGDREEVSKLEKNFAGLGLGKQAGGEGGGKDTSGRRLDGGLCKKSSELPLLKKRGGRHTGGNINIRKRRSLQINLKNQED